MAVADPVPAEVTVVDRQRAARVSPVRVAAFAEYVLERQRRPGAQVTVLLVGDRAMRALNRRWRGKDAPTDVLAFSQREGEGGGLHPELLGDVVISVEQAARQAPGGDLLAELVRLLVHGLCHLRGLDHARRADAARMRAEEARLLGVVGVG